MFKKLLLPVLCVASLFSASEAFATDKAIKAVSGEAACFGFFAPKNDGVISIRNFDPTHSISFDKIRVYNKDGQLIQLITPPGFPQDFKEVLAPNASSYFTIKQVLTDTNLGDVTFKISFKSTDGTAAIAPYIATLDEIFSSTSKTSVVAEATFDCVYTVLK